MDIAAHIGKLVLEHECVIIPDLGAFLTNYHAAEINQQNRIQPPTRNLVFNAQLNTNDGLLAHHLTQRLDISYKTSLQLLELFASYCQRDLAEGKRISFGELGILDRNNHNKLEFYPNTSINYHEDAFGLKPLAINAIERKPDFSLRAPLLKKEIKLPVTKVITLNRSALRKVAAVLIPIAILVSALVYLPSLVQNKNVQQTSVLSFLDSSKASIFSAEEIDNTATDQMTGYSEENIGIDDVEVDAAEMSTLIEDANIENISEATEFIVQEHNIDVPKGQFHIICGSFIEKDRAEALINHLKSDGFTAYLAGQSKFGTYRVSMKSFTSSVDAHKQINWVRHQGYDKAWILNKIF